MNYADVNTVWSKNLFSFSLQIEIYKFTDKKTLGLFLQYHPKVIDARSIQIGVMFYRWLIKIYLVQYAGS